MAQFRAVIRGQKGEASRLGSKKSGISAHVNGWDVGVYVEAKHTSAGDVFHIFSTGGSNGTIRTFLGEVVAPTGAWIPACPRCASTEHVVCHRS